MKELIDYARDAMKKSYSPYSKFSVGAALKCKSGKIYLGTNIENASYSATVCAERVAIFNAVSNGETDFEKIAIVGSKELCYPCGVCRQVMTEFCDKDFIIEVLDEKNNIIRKSLGELLPYSFTKENM